MKKLILVTAMMVLAAPLYAQEDSIDVTNILGALGGNQQGGRGRGNQPQIPVAADMYKEIETALKNGKTPLDKAQVKPLQSLLNTEIVSLTDQIQLLRNGESNNNNNNQQGGRGRGGRGGEGNQGSNQQSNQNNQQSSATAITVETLTQLHVQEFYDSKLALFLSPEQIALIKKTVADDKEKNSTCLQGIFDRYYQQMQNPNRGNNNNNNQNFPNNRGSQNNNNNNYNNNNQSNTRPNGMKYCMTIDAMPSDRLEPIRKVLAKANMPIAKDKETFATVAVQAQLGELQDAIRKGLSGNNNNNNNGNRGNQNNRNQDPRQLIENSKDNILKKVEATLTPQQAETLRDWHYTQILSKGGIEALIAIEALADTPLTDEQVTKVKAAWPEYQRKIQDLAKQTNTQISDKQRQSAAMNKILDDFLEPSQVASYKLALKYGPETGSK